MNVIGGSKKAAADARRALAGEPGKRLPNGESSIRDAEVELVKLSLSDIAAIVVVIVVVVADNIATDLIPEPNLKGCI
jgi:hypothetical protein